MEEATPVEDEQAWGKGGEELRRAVSWSRRGAAFIEGVRGRPDWSGSVGERRGGADEWGGDGRWDGRDKEGKSEERVAAIGGLD